MEISIEGEDTLFRAGFIYELCCEIDLHVSIGTDFERIAI
jgi:hypothetical protein